MRTGASNPIAKQRRCEGVTQNAEAVRGVRHGLLAPKPRAAVYSGTRGTWARGAGAARRRVLFADD